MQPQTYTPEDTSEFAGVIYGLHTGDHVYRYIGKTVRTLHRRFTIHLSDARRGSELPVHRWVRKHGESQIRVCAIATFDEETIHLIDEVEIFHISQCRDIFTQENLNLTDGGDGASGRIHTKKTKTQISLSLTGRTHSEERRAKNSASQLGKTLSAEHRAKLSDAHTGRIVSAETGAKISASKRGKPNLGTHTRWHVNRGICNPDCIFCQEEHESTSTHQFLKEGN